MTKKPRIGIALSGGAARCIAHLGVLEVLEKEGIVIDSIAGTSGGAFVGALYASGLGVDKIKEIALQLSWRAMVKPVFSKQGLISGKNLHRYISKYIGALHFKDLQIPLAVVAADLKSGDKVVLTEGLVSEAVTASCSLPVIFSPAHGVGKILVDGGIASNLPVLTLVENMGATLTIAVDVNDRARELSNLNNLFQIGIHTVTLFAKKNAAVEKRFADIVINVDASGISLIDLKKGPLILKRGRAAAEKQIPFLKKCLKEFSYF
ncbi:MAG: patatin-like phospholipase family protein [Nitrospirae bacterium]|nr:patatin-like phospholipase family protein [Nitrospirota bacterium]MBI3351055.1 patatin-like phospholipase family protein [Nitrospirota bacterium]